MYKLNRETLEYEKVKFKTFAKIGLLLLLVSFSLSYTSVRVLESERVPVVISNDIKDELTDESLMQFLKDCNVKFPDIVFKQAILESKHFTSNIFKQNSNLFGMRISTSRPTTHKGDKYEKISGDYNVEVLGELTLRSHKQVNVLCNEDVKIGAGSGILSAGAVYMTASDKVYVNDNTTTNSNNSIANSNINNNNKTFNLHFYMFRSRKIAS